MKDRLLNVDQARRRIGVGRTKMYELMDQGDIDFVYVGQRRRIKESVLDEYIETLVR